MEDWIDGDPSQPTPPAERHQGRNADWRHLFNRDVISMPDKWEYPWYAAWDLAFHTVALAMVAVVFSVINALTLSPALAAMLLRRNGVVAAPTMGALQALLSHDWPGNVRELSNVLERAAILAGGQPIATHHIGIEVRQPAASSLADDLRQHETQALQTALAETDGRRSEAAARLGISERALRYKLAALAGRPRNPARAGASARLVLA